MSDTAPRLLDHVRFLARRAWLIVLVAALAVGAALAASYLQPKRYRAEVSTVVANVDNKTLAGIATSDVVLQNVIGNLRLDDTPGELRDRVDVDAQAGTRLLRIRVQDGDRQLVIRMAQEISLVFAQLVKERFAPTGAEAPSVTVFDQAHAAEDPVAPRPLRNAFVALPLGLLLGVLAATLLGAPVRRVRGRDEIERLLGAPVVGDVDGEVALRERLAALELKTPLQSILVAPVRGDSVERAAAAVAASVDDAVVVSDAEGFELRDEVRRLCREHDHVVVAGAAEDAAVADAVVLVVPRHATADEVLAAREAAERSSFLVGALVSRA